MSTPRRPRPRRRKVCWSISNEMGVWGRRKFTQMKGILSFQKWGSGLVLFFLGLPGPVCRGMPREIGMGQEIVDIA